VPGGCPGPCPRVPVGLSRQRCHSGSAHYQKMEHTADHAFHVLGRDLAELFRNSVAVMFALQGAQRGCDSAVQRDVEVTSIDGETLLVNWLDEPLHLQETQRENCGPFDIQEILDNTCAPTSKGICQRSSLL